MFGLSQLKLAIALAGFLGTVAVTGIVVHRFDNARYAALELKYANAEREAAEAARTEERRIAAIHERAAAINAAAQEKITTHTITILQEVPRYVKETAFVGCIPLGFVRVLDAEILGVAPADLPLAAGNTDDTCTPVDPAVLAQRIIANFSLAKQNAEQLNSLGAAVKP